MNRKKEAHKQTVHFKSDFDNGYHLQRDECAIWKRFKEGDEQSLIYIYQQYAGLLYNYGSQFCSRSEFVKDCVQELFYELIDRRKKLADVHSIKAYLFSCLKRKIVKGLKKEERFLLNEKGLELGFMIASISISTQGLEKSEYEVIEGKLNALPPQQKEVILLYFYEGLSYLEIADIMNIKVKSARALAYRALNSLTRLLLPYKKKGSIHFPL